jgi:hypothetical protein
MAKLLTALVACATLLIISDRCVAGYVQCQALGCLPW